MKIPPLKRAAARPAVPVPVPTVPLVRPVPLVPLVPLVPPVPPVPPLPPAPPMLFTTASGKLMTAAQLLRAAARQPAPAPIAHTMASLPGRQIKQSHRQALSATAPLEARDVEVVFDALVIGGTARSKTWVMNFLKAWRHTSARGALLSHAEVAQAIGQLLAARRIEADQGRGFAIARNSADAALARLTALLSGEHAGHWWRWAIWAGADGYGSADELPRWIQLHKQDELAAALRLLVYSGISAGAYARLLAGPLHAARDASALFSAINTPFMPALFERMDSALRLDIINRLDPWSANVEAAPLNDWIAAWLDRAPKEVPLSICYRVAERRMHALDLPGMHAALAGHAGSPVSAMFAAAELAVKGEWAAAAEGFAAAYKTHLTAVKVKRGAVPMGLTWIYPMALLAQASPQAWSAARKFCIAESGSRKPSAYDPWGRWAHAAGVRLGDEAFEDDALALPSMEREFLPTGSGVDAAHRLLLAALLGSVPAGWSPQSIARLIAALVAARRYWLAKLVQLACVRLKIAAAPPALPALLQATLPAPVAFFGAEREAWRDALAAITALGGTALSAPAAAAPAATLIWQLRLDAEGRVDEVQAFERILGARGWGKPKAASLARVKKMPRLDPRDAAVARCIDTDRYSRGLMLDPVAAAQALVHHPALTFADAPAQLVELSESLPALEVSRRSAANISAANSSAANPGAKAAAGTPASAGSAAAVADSFVFRIDPPLTSTSEPEVRFYGGHKNYEDALERLNSLRIVRDAPDRARLIRISPAQRRVAELISKDWSVPVDAKDELDAALRVLSGHFQLHSDAEAGQEVPGEARLRAQLTPQSEGLHLRLVVMPFGSFGPAVPPGAGRARMMTMHEGLSLATVRELEAERSHWRAVIEALPFLDDGSDAAAGWMLADPEQALRAVEALPGLPAIAALDWPRGKPLRVVSVDSAALGVQVASGRDWFALQGEVRVDEARVLSLQRVMELARAGRSRFVALGEGEYLALSDRLRQQLADLEAAGRSDKDGLKLPLAAAAWLDGALEGASVKSDGAWQQRITALADAAELMPVVAGLQTELRSYQHDGFAWMARLAHAGLGACLADDMGLGKTIQTLALLLRRAADGPALVLAPTSVCANWIAETIKFAPGLNARLYGEHGEAGRAALVTAAGPYDVIVASYSLAQGDSEVLGGRAWNTLVLDEAQALKNAATQRARAVSGYDAAFRLALSGTPVENRLSDLWSIMNLINPGLLGSASQFGERFAAPIEKQRDMAARTRLRRLVSPFLLRRTKMEVLQDLPPRTEIIHRIEPSEQERSFLEALRRSASERVKALAESGDGAAATQSSFQVLAELTRLRRAACDPRLVAPELGIVGAKTQEFERLVRELVDGQHKALVFSQFTGFLKLLAERLDGCGIQYQYLDGSTPAAERAKRVQAFQRGEGEVFLISLKAGGFGLNLTAADYVLIVDPWWNPAAEDQAMGRAHRIGQQRPVTVYRLVTAGSIEERIVELHGDKRSLADGILQDQGDATPLNAQVLRELLLGDEK